MFAKVFALPLLLVAGAAAATQQPDKLTIEPTSSMGAVIFAAPALGKDYRLAFGRYEPATRQVASGGSRSVDLVQADPDAIGYQWFITDLKPGTYVVMQVFQQQHWGLCYAAATWQFSVAPGQIVYLGNFDARASFGELQSAASRNGNSSSYNIQYFQYFASSSPYLTDADNGEGLRRASEWLKTASPRTTSAPASATIAPASFLSGETTPGKGKCIGKPTAR